MLDPSKMSYEELLLKVKEKFEIDFEDIRIGDINLSLIKIVNLEDYIDKLADEVREGERLELPFWAKIWPTSLLLSYVLLKLPMEKGDELLEIGAGTGLCGLVAASMGFNVTISDIEQDALMISQINVLKNGLQQRARVERVDFTSDRLSKKFRYIIGSEVLYKQEHFRPLVKFFLRHLRDENSFIILAKDYHLKAKKFYKLAQEHFVIQEKVIGYKEKDNEKGERHLCTILRLSKKL